MSPYSLPLILRPGGLSLPGVVSRDDANNFCDLADALQQIMTPMEALSAVPDQIHGG